MGDMTLEELHNTLLKLGWAKDKEVTKKPIRGPYSVEGMSHRLITYTHPRTSERIKIDLSENMVLGVWRDNRRRARTAWSPLITIEDIIRMLSIG